MRNLLLRLFVVGFLALTLLALIGSLLPRKYSIETSISIQSAPERVFELVNSLPNWQQWSSFNESRIEGLKVSFGPIKSGEGAVLAWSEFRGNGKLWITASRNPTLVEYQTEFAKFPVAYGRFTFQPSSESTTVVWSSEGSLPGGPFYGFFRLLAESQLSQQFADSLAKLKEVCESN